MPITFKAELRYFGMLKSTLWLFISLTCFFVQPTFAGNVMLFGNPETLPEFVLLDQNGNSFTKQELEKQWSLIFFGYTSCPDVCPTTLGVLDTVTSLIKAKPGKDNLPVKSIFVSLDPVRDTPRVLRDYIKYFNDDFVAVTGKNNSDIDRLTYPIGVKYDFEDIKTNLPIEDVSKLSKDSEYLVNHFAGIFIIDPSARVAAIVFPPHEAEQFIKIFTFIRQSDYAKNQ